MHGLVCRTSSTYFFRITHAEGEGLADSQCEWRTRQEHSGCDLSVQENFCHKQFMVLEERYTTDLEDYRKGY